MKNKTKQENSRIIAALRAKGYKVRISHFRDFIEYVEKDGAEFYNPNPVRMRYRRRPLDGYRFVATEGCQYDLLERGGETQIIIEGNDLEVVAKTVCSVEQNFNYYRGVNIALNRAVASNEQLQGAI